jgi:branched-chain amino acid transport system ATP-binding protein
MTQFSGLEAAGVTVERSGFAVVRDIAFRAPLGAITVLLGANGAGRTTLLEAISGVIPSRAGEIRLGGASIGSLTRLQRYRNGLAHVEQGRTVFAQLTAQENLVATAPAGRTQQAYEWFPELAKRRNVLAAQLSGGEQQMLVIARALLGRPRFLMIDELSLGLAPIIVQRLLPILRQLAEQGLGVLLVEQYARLALGIGDYAYVMSHGEVVLEGKCSELINTPEKLHEAYLS